MRKFTNSHASFAPQGFYAIPDHFVIKGFLLANLPKFTSLPSEDAHKHILGLYHTCSSMKPPQASLNEVVLLRIFQFSLKGRAKDWLLNLFTHYATLTWDQIKLAFPDQYFPITKVSRMRKEITGFSQLSNETLYGYWS